MKQRLFTLALACLLFAGCTTTYSNSDSQRKPATSHSFQEIVTTREAPGYCDGTGPGYSQAAHMLYDEWGGGGGQPAEHLKSAANAFRCVADR